MPARGGFGARTEQRWAELELLSFLTSHTVYSDEIMSAFFASLLSKVGSSNLAMLAMGMKGLYNSDKIWNALAPPDLQYRVTLNDRTGLHFCQSSTFAKSFQVFVPATCSPSYQ